MQLAISLFCLLHLFLLPCTAFFHVSISSRQTPRPWTIHHRAIYSSSSKRLGVVASELPDNEEESEDTIDYELDEKMQEDKELEQRMAKQLFDDLRGDDPLLTKEKFIKWDDIDELLSRGAFDGETLEIIYTECGISGENLNYDQFLEVVDLVNQVSAVLDQDLQSVLNTDIETEIIDDDTEIIGIEDEDEDYLGLPGIDLSWMPKSIQ